MFLHNLRNTSTKLIKKLSYSTFNIDSLNEVKLLYKTTSDIPVMQEYQRSGDDLVQSKIMNHVNNKKNTKKTKSFLGKSQNANYNKEEEELVNTINAGPSHDVFFNNNQNRDSIIELKYLTFTNKLDTDIRTICGKLLLHNDPKSADIDLLEDALSKANGKDMKFINTNRANGYQVDKVHKYELDDTLFMKHEYTLLFHYKMLNNQMFDLKAIAKKLRVLNADLNLKQFLYIINNLTKIGRFQDVKDFLEIYFDFENQGLDETKPLDLSKLFFYKYLNYDFKSDVDENKVKIEILENLIKIYYETNDYTYLKDLIRLRERLSPIKLVDNTTMFIRIMIRLMGNYNPYYIINISNNYIQQQNTKYEPLDKMLFYKIMESMIKFNDAFLLADFIEQWEPVIYKGTRVYLDPLCIVMIERFKETLINSKAYPQVSAGVFRHKVDLYLNKFNDFKTRIENFKTYKHMSKLLVNFENDLHFKPIRSVTDLLDKIASNELLLDPLAVSYFVSNTLKISCNNIIGMPNLVNHLFNCKIKSYNGVELLDYSYYLIKTEYYKNRYDIFMNFFKYKPELVYKNLSTIIEMFMKNNPSLIIEFELLLKCYRSTMSLDNEQMIQNLHDFNKNFDHYFRTTKYDQKKPVVLVNDETKPLEYRFLDINRFKRSHYIDKIKYIDYFCRYRPSILKIVGKLVSDKKQLDITKNDVKFFSKIYKEVLPLLDNSILYNEFPREFQKSCINTAYNSLLRRKIPTNYQMAIINYYRNKFYHKYNIEFDHTIFKNKIRILLEERHAEVKEEIFSTHSGQIEHHPVAKQQHLLAEKVKNIIKKNDRDTELNEKAIAIFIGHLRDIQYSISETAGRTNRLTWSPNNKLNIQLFMEDAITYLQSSNLLLAMSEVLKLYLSAFGDKKLFRNTDIKIDKQKRIPSDSKDNQEYTKTADPYFRFINPKTLKRIDLAILRLVNMHEITNTHLKMYSSIIKTFEAKYGETINLESSLEPTIPFNTNNSNMNLLEKHNLLKDIKENYKDTEIFFVLKLLKELLSAREVYSETVSKTKSIGIARLENILDILNKIESLSNSRK